MSQTSVQPIYTQSVFIPPLKSAPRPQTSIYGQKPLLSTQGTDLGQDNHTKFISFLQTHIYNEQGKAKPSCTLKQYDSKEYYEGQIDMNKQRNGMGAYYFQNGDKYCGAWVADLPQGPGMLVYSTGDRYEGDFMKGQRHGKGKFYYANGNIYEGDFLQNRKEGKGAYLYKVTHEKYEGD